MSARAEELPTLTIITNNSYGGRCGNRPSTSIPTARRPRPTSCRSPSSSPSPDFEKVVETCGGYGEKVEDPTQLMPALERALEEVRSGTPATLNVLTQARR